MLGLAEGFGMETVAKSVEIKTEVDMLKYRNFGKKSLNEIKDKLVELGLGLGMTFDEDVLDPSVLAGQPNSSGGSPSLLFDDDDATSPINPASALFD